MENNSTLEKILWVLNRNAELLRLVGATFYFKVASFRRMMKKNFEHSEKFAEKKAFAYDHFLFYLFCRCVYIWVVKYQLKVFGTYLYAHCWTYLWQCCIWNFSQYYNNLYFIEQLLIEILYEILFSIMAFIEIYAIKVSVWTPYYYFLIWKTFKHCLSSTHPEILYSGNM